MHEYFHSNFEHLCFNKVFDRPLISNSLFRTLALRYGCSSSLLFKMLSLRNEILVGTQHPHAIVYLGQCLIGFPMILPGFIVLLSQTKRRTFLKLEFTASQSHNRILLRITVQNALINWRSELWPVVGLYRPAKDCLMIVTEKPADPADRPSTLDRACFPLLFSLDPIHFVVSARSLVRFWQLLL